MCCGIKGNIKRAVGFHLDSPVMKLCGSLSKCKVCYDFV